MAITPACANVEPYAASIIGIVAGAGAVLAVEAKNRLRYDDALDVVGVHLVAGVLTLVIALALRKTMGLRIDARGELAGIDGFEHAEQAYSFR